MHAAGGDLAGSPSALAHLPNAERQLASALLGLHTERLPDNVDDIGSLTPGTSLTGVLRRMTANRQ